MHQGRSRARRLRVEKDEKSQACHVAVGSVLRAISLVKSGSIYDLECERWNKMPLWLGHPPFQVLSYRTPHGLRVSGDHPEFLGQNDPRMGWFSEMVIGTVHSGTHIDALGHITTGDDAHWYGGMNEAEDSGDFGLLRGDACAIPPLLTRGVMLDVASYKGVDVLPKGYAISLDDVQGTLSRQGLQIEKDDVVIVRTGYMGVWPKAECADVYGSGITWEVAAYLADRGVVVVGADTESLEVVPSVDPTNPHPTHIELLNKRGVHIMEMVYQEELARDQVYEFLFVMSPLKIRGASGSLIRPLAVV
jgi:kynurenine formamidase